MKYHQLGGSSHRSGGYKSECTLAAGPFPWEASEGWTVPGFSPWFVDGCLRCVSSQRPSSLHVPFCVGIPLFIRIPVILD